MTDQTSIPTLDNAQKRTDPYAHTLLGNFDRRFLASKNARSIVAVVLFIILIVPSIQFVRTIQKIDDSPFRTGGIRHRTALGRWLPSAQALADYPKGDNPYGYGHWFPTPPMVLICLIPLAKMGFVGAGIVWSILKLLGLFGSICLLLREYDRQARPIPTGVLIVAALFSIRPIISDIQHGNLNIFMMIWLTLAWTYYLRKADITAGLFLAAAIVTKITPALALVYFLYKKNWKLCAAALVCLAVFVLLVPGLMLGFESNMVLLRTWFDMLVRPFAIDGYATLELPNQSLYGVILRLMDNTDFIPIQHMPAEQMMNVGMEEMARPQSRAWRLLRTAISLAVVAVLAWSCRRKHSARTDPIRLLEFSAVLIAMLLLSERTWKHHATTLPLVYLALWYAVACLPWTDKFRATLVAGLGAQLVLLSLLGEGFVGDDLADKILDGGFFCWGLVLCFVQIVIILRRFRNPLQPAELSPSPPPKPAI